MAANDWIRLNKGFITKPEVVRTAVALKVDKWRAAGAWITILDWADDLTEDGFIPRLDGDAIDAIVDLPGFFAVACAVGWMAVDADGVRFLNYTRYNTKSAKARSVDAKRQAKKRYRGQNSDENRTELGHNSDETRTKVRATYTETVTSNTTTPTPPTPISPNSGGGGVAFSARFSLLQKRPPWLPSAHEWIGKPKARELARSRLTGDDFGEIYDDIQRRVNGMKNPAGVFISMCEQRIKEADDGSRTLPVVPEGGEVANARGGAA